MINIYICPTCGHTFQSARRRKFCAPACYPSQYSPTATQAERHASLVSRAAAFRQRRAAGEPVVSIAAAEGITRQRAYEILKTGQQAASKKMR